MSENITNQQAGRYSWTSEPDADGDVAYAANLKGFDGVLTRTGRPGKGRPALLPRDEARRYALAILYLLDGERPNLEYNDPRDEATHD